MENSLDLLRRFFAKRGVDIAPEHINENSSLQDDLGLDSLDTIDIVMDIESELGIGIPDEELEKWVTVGDMVRTIDSLRS